MLIHAKDRRAWTEALSKRAARSEIDIYPDGHRELNSYHGTSNAWCSCVPPIHFVKLENSMYEKSRYV